MTNELVQWLLTHGPEGRGPLELAQGLAERLDALGVPLDRLWLATIRTHPLLAGEAAVWRRGRGIERRVMPYADRGQLRAASSFLAAPFHRLRLDALERGAHDLPGELWDEGYRELITMSFRHPDGAPLGLLTAASRSEAGFGETAAILEGAHDALFLLLRWLEAARLAETALSTYLGAEAARRVLAGQIHRGDGETIRAAIWFSDLREFSSLSDRLPREALLKILDEAFEAQVNAVEARGGEVMKFIGDGLLAIFRDESAGSHVEACRAALAAAADFRARLGAVNVARQARGEVVIGCGLALHHGDVMFGNIGAPSRLDFTVIGPAVNLAARLEGLCPLLGVATLMSATFAAMAGAPCQSVGRHVLKGLTSEVEAFVPA